jgi:hypothetical protein
MMTNADPPTGKYHRIRRSTTCTLAFLVFLVVNNVRGPVGLHDIMTFITASTLPPFLINGNENTLPFTSFAMEASTTESCFRHILTLPVTSHSPSSFTLNMHQHPNEATTSRIKDTTINNSNKASLRRIDKHTTSGTPEREYNDPDTRTISITSDRPPKIGLLFWNKYQEGTLDQGKKLAQQLQYVIGEPVSTYYHMREEGRQPTTQQMSVFKDFMQDNDILIEISDASTATKAPLPSTISGLSDCTIFLQVVVDDLKLWGEGAHYASINPSQSKNDDNFNEGDEDDNYDVDSINDDNYVKGDNEGNPENDDDGIRVQTNCLDQLSDLIVEQIEQWSQCIRQHAPLPLKREQHNYQDNMHDDNETKTKFNARVKPDNKAIDTPRLSNILASCPAHENIARKIIKPTTIPFHRFVQGPGLNLMKAKKKSNSTVAPCIFMPFDFSKHYPHAMQQLYRCFSWWQANPDKESLLVGGEHLIPKAIDKRRKNEKSQGHQRDASFLSGFIPALFKVFHVRHVPMNVPFDRSNSVQSLNKGAYDLHTPQDAIHLRNGLLSHFQWYDPRTATCVDPAGHRPTIGILNRKKTRSLLNIAELTARLRKSINASMVNIVSFEGKSYEEQVRFMARTDILISPHGAQLASIAFLPRCGSVLEFFPAGYYIPKFFGSLAQASGVLSHATLYLGNDRATEVAQSMQNARTRSQARKVHICADVNKVVRHVQTITQQWSMCCARRRVPAP